MNTFGIAGSSMNFDDGLENNPFADVVSQNRPASTSLSTHVLPEQTDIMPTATEPDNEEENNNDKYNDEEIPGEDTHSQITDSVKALCIDPSFSQTEQRAEPEAESKAVEDSNMEGSMDSQSDTLEIPKSGSRPFFQVSVEDPQKVGDAINAHIIYKVRTKTNSPAFRAPEFVVARRYRDFLWLYNQLTLGNPGRFQDEFVESRRIALERCLSKIVSHPMLYGDPDLKVFLESESFNIEKRQKRAEPETPKLGFMRSFGETLSNAATSPFSKFIEVDEWFVTKKNQLDGLEAQLKALLKSVESVVKQRKELGAATADFGETMFPLASAELNRNLSTHLTLLSEVQMRLKKLHEEQARYDILTLEHTIDEYIRIIGSIRLAFSARMKAYQSFQQAESDLQKKQAFYERLKAQSKGKHDRLTAVQQEINEMTTRVDDQRREFEDISHLIKNELDRFDKEKVEDFRDSVEQFLCSMVEHQKQVIAVWEEFFERTKGLEDEETEEDDDDLES
ncbi:Vacuolar protein sorting-associated protein 5 [Apophysomyces ossiformis]|uniref:Vacuolar protein sorting-associated protein 5 n=1 Tax=Apophysomyces ossiformis TaxID=679940 RepID=A0A8H7EQK5_9FUNG|nr:Vacuolar protein sorting-associated protein 5 [Apophysomyces ossiformis]